MTNYEEAAEHAAKMFSALWGDRFDFGDEHFAETPLRFVKMLDELTTPCETRWKTFTQEGNEMVIVKDITFTSLCAHHVVPFMGVAHVAYIPNGKIAGLSKFARVVKHFAAGLQVQEALTTQIADYLEHELDPLGVAVVLEAEHLCMSIRGIQSPGAKTITSCMYGHFGDHERLARSEFLKLIREP